MGHRASPLVRAPLRTVLASSVAIALLLLLPSPLGGGSGAALAKKPADVFGKHGGGAQGIPAPKLEKPKFDKQNLDKPKPPKLPAIVKPKPKPQKKSDLPAVGSPGPGANSGGGDDSSGDSPSSRAPEAAPAAAPAPQSAPAPALPTIQAPQATTPAAPRQGPSARAPSSPASGKSPSRGTGRRGTDERVDRAAARAAAVASREAGPASDERRLGRAAAPEESPRADDASPVTRTVRDIVEVLPDSIKRALAALIALSAVLAIGSLLAAMRARRLERQKARLLDDVGLLQRALLPEIPNTLGELSASVSYRPADGPGAGGDFYDAIPLRDGRVAFLLGDVSGHGRDALECTAFIRYTLRAYLEAGLEPRVALQVAGGVIEHKLGGDFVTVVVAVHDPATGSLTYSAAGHPPPIVVGAEEHQPILAAASPPIGVGERTGLRQTTVPFPHGAVACLHTDGLTEARTARGLLGRGRLSDIVRELGPEGSADELIDRVVSEARSAPDDMATCVLSPTSGVTAGGFRKEQLEVPAGDASGPLPTRFLAECGVTGPKAERALEQVRADAKAAGAAVIEVGFGNRRTVRVLYGNVESIQVAAARAATP